MCQEIKMRIQKLRELMKERGIDAYIIPSADNHQSEYVGEYFKAREYMTGFTGSAGTAIVMMDEAGLWTDGRYFLQAENQLKDTGIELYRIGNPGVPSIEKFLIDKMPESGVLGFDGRLIAMKEGSNFEQKLAGKKVSIKYDEDLVDLIWENRPELSKEKVFYLEEKYSGESTTSKLKRVREYMNATSSNYHILTSLDDIAWLFNIRGNDVKYSPFILSYAIIGLEDSKLFIDESKLSDEIKSILAHDKIELRPYNEIYEAVKEFKDSDTILLDPNRMNYALYKNLSPVSTKAEATNPTVLFKAMKNKTELDNMRNAQIKDGVALTKLMYWIKNNYKNEEITELSASDKLEEFRKQQDGYLWQSFAPICAFKDHAAMMHYSATEESNVRLVDGHLFLIDTGGNYYEGSTDITRTMALGEVSSEIKTHFTAVVRGMINLSRAKFLYGCRGYNLDILARQPIWDLDLDYKCGTGHGIGYLLSIHEGPCGFRWYVAPHIDDSNVLEEGMVITNEPGIYIDGSHGIRIENELVIRKGTQNIQGQFMYMEAITFVPIDLDAIDVKLMNREEREYLNNYHKMVYEKISPFLTEEEKIWLKEYTREINPHH